MSLTNNTNKSLQKIETISIYAIFKLLFKSIFNLINVNIKFINFIFRVIYRGAIALGILFIIYLLLPSPFVIALNLFNYLPDFLTVFHKAPEPITVTLGKEMKELQETISLLSNIIVYQDASILELNSQLKEVIAKTIPNLKQDLTSFNTEYKKEIEGLKGILNELPSKIIPVAPEIVLPEINTKNIEAVLGVNLQTLNTNMTNIFNKVNEFSALQKIQLEQGVKSHNLLSDKFTVQVSSLSELKTILNSSTKTFLNTLSASTKDLLLNLSTTNLSSSVTENKDLLTKIMESQKTLLGENKDLLDKVITNQKGAFTKEDLIKGLETLDDKFKGIEKVVYDEVLAGKNDVHNRFVSLEKLLKGEVKVTNTKIDKIQADITAIKTPAESSWSLWGNSNTNSNSNTRSISISNEE